MENRKNHALNHLKPYIFGASVLKKDDRETREMELFADRLTRHPCFMGRTYVVSTFADIKHYIIKKNIVTFAAITSNRATWAPAE